MSSRTKGCMLLSRGGVSSHHHTFMQSYSRLLNSLSEIPKGDPKKVSICSSTPISSQLQEQESLHPHLLTLLKSVSGQDTGVLQQMKVLSGTFLGNPVALSHIKLVRTGLSAQANATHIGCWTDGKGPQVWLLTQK